MLWPEAVSKGIAVGIGLAFVIGPVFFKLMNMALTEGFRQGIKFAVGIFASDFLYACLIWVGVGGLLSQLGQSMTLAIVGGGVLVLLGISTLVRKPVSHTETMEGPKPGQRYGAIGKGFLMNFFNPGTSVVWIGAGTAGTDLATRGGWGIQGLYLGCILMTVLLTDLAKVYLARSLKSFLTPAHLRNVNIFAGIAMIAAGALLITTVALRWAEGQ